MSEVMQALYEGRRADAEAAAVDAELDVFEAARWAATRGWPSCCAATRRSPLAWSDDGFTRPALRLLLRHPRLHDHPARRRRADRRAQPQRHGRPPDQRRRRRPHPFDHVRILLARGADVDGRQASGHTALDEARIRDDQQLIDLLTHGRRRDGAPSRLAGDPAAVDGEGLAGHVAARRRWRGRGGRRRARGPRRRGPSGSCASCSSLAPSSVNISSVISDGNQPGRQRVHPHALAGPLHAELAGEVHDGALGGAVRRLLDRRRAPPARAPTPGSRSCRTGARSCGGRRAG